MGLKTLYDGKSSSDYEHSIAYTEHLSSVSKPNNKSITRYPTINSKKSAPNGIKNSGGKVTGINPAKYRLIKSKVTSSINSPSMPNSNSSSRLNTRS